MSVHLSGLYRRWQALAGDRSLRRGASAGLLLFTVAFILVMLFHERRQLQQLGDWRSFLLAGGQALLLYPISLALQAAVWSLMMERLGGLRRDWRDAQIFAYTHLLRRLPGTVWYVAGRVAFYRERGGAGGAALAASSLEWLLLLAASGGLYLMLVLAKLVSPWAAVLALAAVVTACAGLLSAAPRLRRPAWLRGPFARAWDGLALVRSPRRRDICLWLAAYAGAYLVGGLILLILLRSVAPGSALTLPDATRIWSLTGGVDFLASMLIPAGLGLREATLTALLAPYVPAAQGLLVAVSLRVVFLAGDLVWGGALWVIGRRLGGRTAPANGSPE